MSSSRFSYRAFAPDVKHEGNNGIQKPRCFKTKQRGFYKVMVYKPYLSDNSAPIRGV
ncbi:hypothetical protein EV561_104423 [Rhizobium sp. BK376]|nr:hypothetical protein EV561_104423 [Rhizobium sp. BK376]